jgi:hypothetical protein
MTTIQYNACDSTIYGLNTTSLNNQFSSVCSFRPVDSLFSTLGLASGFYHPGQEGAMDAANNIYMFENGSTGTSMIGGYNIASGFVVFNTSVSPFNNSILFRGLSYNCDSARVEGLEIRLSSQEIYRSTVNVFTGTLTQLSVAVPDSFYFGPGGATLDHSTGTFYYMSDQSTISGFDSFNNHMVDSLSSVSILGIETMTACACAVATGIPEDITPAVVLYPNPCSDELLVNAAHTEEQQTLNIYTATGQLVYTAVLTPGSNRIDVRAFTSGVYFYSVNNATGIAQGRFVKE